MDIRLGSLNSKTEGPYFHSSASAILVMSEKKALQLGLEPLARIIGWGNGSVKQQIMGMGPVPATKKALKHAGIHAEQVDRSPNS